MFDIYKTKFFIILFFYIRNSGISFNLSNKYDKASKHLRNIETTSQENQYCFISPYPAGTETN